MTDLRLDLTRMMEPITVHMGDKTYTADPDVSAVLAQRVAVWCGNLASADEAEADSASVELVAAVFKITADATAQLPPRARRNMLLFFQNAPFIGQEG